MTYTASASAGRFASSSAAARRVVTARSVTTRPSRNGWFSDALTAPFDVAEGVPSGSRGTAAATGASEPGRLRRRLLLERRKHFGGRAEAQRGIADAQGVGALGNLDLDVRRHARLQLQFLVRHRDDSAVGGDVLHHHRLQADLRDRALEAVSGVGVDAERDVLTRTNATHVGFIDVRIDLHFGQVGGDHEQRWRRHAGRHRLADVNAALRDDAVDRRRDDGVIAVDLRLVDRRFRLGHRRL